MTGMPTAIDEQADKVEQAGTNYVNAVETVSTEVAGISAPDKEAPVLDLMTGMPTSIDEQADKVNDSVENYKSAVEGANYVMDNDMHTWTSGAYSGEKWKNIGDETSDAINEATETVESSISNYLSAIDLKTKMEELGLDPASIFGESFDFNLFGDLDVSSLIPKELYDVVSGDMTSLGENVDLGLAQGILNNTGEVTGGMTDLWSDAENAFHDAGGFGSPSTKMEKYGEWVDEGYVNGMVNKMYLVRLQARKLVTISLNQLDGIKSKFFRYGQQAVEGFANGISNSTYLATTAAKLMAQKTEQAFKNQLQIQSPSKIMYGHGLNTVLGFANGILDNAYKAESAADIMSESTLAGFQSVVTRIMDAINNEWNDDMTIRPVLDLSEIQNGAARIGSYFGNGYAYTPSLGYARNAIATVSNSPALSTVSNGLANMQLIDEIHAMREDISKLESDMMGMQVVMQNGALVGQIGPAMNTWLGKNAAIKKRGG